MSLISALNIAVSSVNTINSAISTVSDNVANADNEDYNARVSKYGNVQSGGVKIIDIARRVNEGLFKDLQRSITDTAAGEVRSDYYERIEDLLGVTGSQTPLIDKTEALSTAWKAFEATPESDAAEKAVISAAKNLTRELGRISDGLDTIEQSLTSDIENTVETLNDTLAEFDRLNDSIVKNKAQHIPISNLENLRDEQIMELSEIMEIKTIANDDGSVAIIAATGLDLSIFNASVFTWDGGTGTLTKSGSTSTNLVTDDKVPDGKLKALIDLKRNDDAAISSTDGIFNPVDKMRNQLDEFAYSLMDDSVTRTTGDVYLTGETDILTNTAVTSGQTLTINAGGQATATVINITTGANNTIADILTSINAITNVEGRLDAHGHLQISTSADGMVIGGTATTGLGITNGIYAADTTPTLNYAYAEEFAQGTSDISGNTNLVGLGGINTGDSMTLQVAGGATSTITFGGGQVNSTNDLLAALNNIEGIRANVTDDGYVNISSVEGALVIKDGTGTPASSATGLDMSFNAGQAATVGGASSTEQATGFFEVISGTARENASRTNIRINDVIAEGTSNLKDGSGSNVIAALSANNRQASGSGLHQTNESYTGMMTGLITDINNKSARFENLFEQDQRIMQNLGTKLRNEVGVDLDEEMAMLTVLQNSYAATARVISVVNQMFSTLEQAVR